MVTYQWKQLQVNCDYYHDPDQLNTFQSNVRITKKWQCTKMKFSIKDSSVNVTKSAGNCGVELIY